MQTFSLLALTLLIHTTLLISAVPLTPSPLNPRAQYCSNAPQSEAGTLPRHLPPLPPRKTTTTVLWCAPNSRTYLILDPQPTSFQPAITALLTHASSLITSRIARLGDTVISGGSYELEGGDWQTLMTWNMDNHQQTWGVLGSAISALLDYMRERGVVEAAFSIFDGGREVGAGMVGGVGMLGRVIDEGWGSELD